MVSRLALIIFFASFVATNAQAAEFIASVDRKELTVDEHLVLTLALYNSDTRLRAQGVNPNVDVTLLSEHFTVGTPRNKTNYNVFRTQGRASSTLQIELFPKKAGAFTIPSFNIDKVNTQPINIKVLPSEYGDAPLAFSRSGASKTALWQGEQVVIYHDTYYRVELDSAKLGGNIELSPTHLELFEHYRLPNSERIEQHHGFQYKVLRNSWTVFPTTPETLSVHLPDTWIVSADQKQIRLPNESISLEVNALPENINLHTLIGKPSFNLEAITQNNHSGDLNSWRISIATSSGFTSLPATLKLDAPPGLRVFIDNKTNDRQNSAEGVTQIAHYTLSAIAPYQGEYALADIKLDYFDPSSGSLKTASFPLPKLLIDQGVQRSAETALTPPTSSIDFQTSSNAPWIISTVLFAALWLTTLLLQIKRKRTKNNDEKNASAKPNTKNNSERPLEEKLLQAFDSRSLEQGLNQWQQQFGNDTQVSDTVLSVQRYYYGQSKDVNITDLTQQVDTACAVIKNKSINKSKSAPDAWRPEAFTKASNNL